MGAVTYAKASAPDADVAYPELTHYSKAPLGKILSTRQSHEPDDKPRGLWVSDDTEYGADGPWGWPAWCKSEGFAVDRLKHRNVVHLDRPSDILWLGSVDQIDWLTKQYGAPIWGNRTGIRWDRIAAQYGGIVITPYQWSRRLEGNARWYYGWDCASGCIWDTSVISSIVPAPLPSGHGG